MQKTLLILAAMLSISFGSMLSAQPNETWKKTFGLANRTDTMEAAAIDSQGYDHGGAVEAR